MQLPLVRPIEHPLFKRSGSRSEPRMYIRGFCALGRYI
jgi:hypothetical protein